MGTRSLVRPANVNARLRLFGMAALHSLDLLGFDVAGPQLRLSVRSVSDKKTANFFV
jgi:hypothetical protein